MQRLPGRVVLKVEGNVTADDGGNVNPDDDVNVNPEVTMREYSDGAQPSISQQNMAARSSGGRLRLPVEGPRCPVPKSPSPIL